MAKRKKSRKSSKCPEPLNTLIDIAGGIAMGAVASRMEKKYNYSKKGKINPYAVSAMGIASGRMKSTEDILRTGAVLGAMGSFDVEADDAPAYRPYTPEDPVFREIRETRVNDNRYAWRLNCEDGSAYGISPYDYETRDEYNAAIAHMKVGHTVDTPESEYVCPTKAAPSSNNARYLYLRVSRLDNGANQYYRTDDGTIKVGDVVTVPTESGDASGVVISVEYYSTENAPTAADETPWALRKLRDQSE